MIVFTSYSSNLIMNCTCSNRALVHMPKAAFKKALASALGSSDLTVHKTSLIHHFVWFTTVGSYVTLHLLNVVTFSI